MRSLRRGERELQMADEIELTASTRFTASDMARAIARNFDDNQAKFINELAYQIHIYCGDKWKSDAQLCGIAKHLDEAGAHFLRQLIGFVEIGDNPKLGCE